MVRSLPCSAEGTGSIPGQETRTPHAVSLCATTVEPGTATKSQGTRKKKKKERLQKDLLPLLSREDKERRWPSLNQGEGSNQTPSLLAP